MAQEAADASMSDYDDQDQAALTKRLFPPGKHYASVRALQVDLMDWATRRGFGFASRQTTACGDGDDILYMGCDRSAVSATDDDTSTSSQSCCTLVIAYCKLQDAPGTVMITQQSVYRHSCGGDLASRSKQAMPLAIDDHWIELKERKSFSRLLYTNPVCFLSTCNLPHQKQG